MSHFKTLKEKAIYTHETRVVCAGKAESHLTKCTLLSPLDRTRNHVYALVTHQAHRKPPCNLIYLITTELLILIIEHREYVNIPPILSLIC